MKNLLQKFQKYANKHASGKKVIFSLVLTQIVYGIMLFFSVPKVLQYSSGMKILDLMPTGYSAEYAQKLFETLGEIGREVYLFQQIPFDMIYPGLFAISFSLFLTFVLKRSFSKESKIQKFNILPVFAGLFDYLENIGIIVMLNSYPDFQAWIANTTSIFSVLKSIFITIVFIFLIIGVIGFLIKKYKDKKSA